MLLCKILVSTIHQKMKNKSYTTKITLKYQLERGMTNFHYLMNHIRYQIFKIILSIVSKI